MTRVLSVRALEKTFRDGELTRQVLRTGDELLPDHLHTHTVSVRACTHNISTWSYNAT